jgi:hypothetical protein
MTRRAEMQRALSNKRYNTMMIGSLCVMMDEFVSRVGSSQKLHHEEQEQKHSAHYWLPASFTQSLDCLNPLHRSVSETERS